MSRIGFFFALGICSAAFGQESDLTEPEQLTKNPGLIGREITVDDRVRFFQSHRGPGGKQVYDELLLKRTPVIFRLPPSLRPERPPREPVAQVRGILREEGRQIICEVESLRMLPADADRLEREAGRLSPRDAAGRRRWGEWAARRGRAFKDDALIERARHLETEAFLIDAERPGADFLALAAAARKRELGDGLVGALARKVFLERIAAAKKSDDLAKLADDIRTFLPGAVDPKAGAGAVMGDWEKRIAVSPLNGYREAPAEVRAALDRRLMADVLRRKLELSAEEEPTKTMALAEEARAALPDRPEVAAKLRDRALSASESSVASMRLSEVEGLAKTFRDDGQAERATRLYQVWLGQQRAKRLSAGDSEGRVLLAAQYERLLNDKVSAVALLREAIQIDPASKEAADAFRRLGFKKSADGQWVDARPASSGAPSETAAAPRPSTETSRAVGTEDDLRGLTPAQVRSRFGSKPEKIVYVASQDATIEQWIYQRAKGVQVVNFRRPRGGGRTVVVSAYTYPN